MPTHLTKAELEQDIWDREGVKVVVHEPEAATWQMRYSEFFKEAMSDDATVSELRLRIDTFMSTQRID